MVATAKRRIVTAAAACKRPGELGALLRREAVYCSMLSTWRKRIGQARRVRARSDFHGGKTWAISGETPIVRVIGQRFSLTMISAISPTGALR